MVQRSGGFRRKTRSKLSKHKSEKGKISIRNFLHNFNKDDLVYLKAEPGYQKGMYFPRFHGKAGIIQTKRGDCYEVLIKDKNKPKTLIIHPIHLKLR